MAAAVQSSWAMTASLPAAGAEKVAVVCDTGVRVVDYDDVIAVWTSHAANASTTAAKIPGKKIRETFKVVQVGLDRYVVIWTSHQH